MNDQTPTLNLARSWRPTTFDTIIGQNLTVKILKNALYAGKFFPVYLFSGQRGCGKTSTARVFAAAVNCHHLPGWRKKPRSTLPCGTCSSCLSMRSAQHPDFIEMDAASHTGVDDIRQLIESASYLPADGNKKIYLIDEAHMLSRSAFNAFLKVLEEPPASVLFILATTEPHKIPDTVRSRCFQARFTPLEATPLHEHLAAICKKESIDYDDDALDLIIRETEGSARDALNLLERVRFAGERVTRKDVRVVVGSFSEEKICELFSLMLEKKTADVLTFLSDTSSGQLTPQSVWNALIDLLRTLMRVQFKAPLPHNTLFQDRKVLDKLADKCSRNRLQAIMHLFWSQEEQFLATQHKQSFLEMVLIQVCQQVPVSDLEQLLTSKTPVKSSKRPSPPPTPIKKKESIKPSVENPWQRFISQIKTLNDPALSSLFARMQFLSFDKGQQVVTAILHKDTPFFREKIEETKKIWHPIFNETYPGTSLLFKAPNLDKSPPSPTTESPPVPQFQQPPPTSFPSRQTFRRTPTPSKGTPIDVSDTKKWPKASLIATYFSTRIEKVGSLSQKLKI